MPFSPLIQEHKIHTYLPLGAHVFFSVLNHTYYCTCNLFSSVRINSKHDLELKLLSRYKTKKSMGSDFFPLFRLFPLFNPVCFVGGMSRSPSSSRDTAYCRDGAGYTRSLPRGQLSLKSGQPKRGSGVWSKPPTPGPYSPGTSDSEMGFSK